MPRDGSGTYTLPAGNPVVSGTIISPTWANPTMTDVANALTGSLPRDGQAGMTGVLKVADGSVSSPGIQFGQETGTGIYRNGTGDARYAVQGVDVIRLTGTAVYVLQALTGPTGKAVDLSNASAVTVPTVAVSDASTNAASTAFVNLKVAAGATLGDLSDVAVSSSGTSVVNTRELVNTRTGAAAITRTLPAAPTDGQMVAFKDVGPTLGDSRGFDVFNLIINPGTKSIEDTPAGELMAVSDRYAYFALKFEAATNAWRIL